MSGSVKDDISNIADSLADLWISGLEESLFQDIYVSGLAWMREAAVPRLMAYLMEQAELEREFVGDLDNYYRNKTELEMEYRKIVTSPTVPQWKGSNENADVLSLCLSKMEANDLVFVKRWGGSPDEVTGFSSPKECPSRLGVEGALLALESIRSQRAIPLLTELVKHAENIQRTVSLSGYCSVFKVRDSIGRILNPWKTF